MAVIDLGVIDIHNQEAWFARGIMSCFHVNLLHFIGWDLFIQRLFTYDIMNKNRYI